MKKITFFEEIKLPLKAPLKNLDKKPPPHVQSFKEDVGYTIAYIVYFTVELQYKLQPKLQYSLTHALLERLIA